MTPPDEGLYDDIWSNNHLEEVRSCSYCGHSSGEIVVSDVRDWFFGNVPGDFEFRRCDSCQSLWLSKRLSQDKLPHAYASYYTHQPTDSDRQQPSLIGRLKNLYARHRYGAESNAFDALGAFFYRKLARNRLELDAKFRLTPKAPRKILDYGCGGGEFLRCMRSLGYETYGVDFDPVAVKALGKSEILAFLPDEFENQDWFEFFDSVSINHVIEHVPDPVALVAKLSAMLKPGGHLFIECPNAHAVGLTIFGKYWRGLEAPRHLNIPSVMGIRIALQRAGLEEHERLIRSSVRSWLWNESMSSLPASDRLRFRVLANEAPSEDLLNSEFITLVATKPRLK